MRRAAGASALVIGASAVAGALLPARPLPFPALAPLPPPAAASASAAEAPPSEAEAPDDSPRNQPEEAAPQGPYASLGPLAFVNGNSGERTVTRLYLPDGAIDERACEALEQALADARKPPRPYPTMPIDRRLLRLVFKAAYRFGAREVEVVSGYRKPGRFPEGMHGKGKAVDFRLDAVEAKPLSEYLRSLARVGVGLYTHPRTRFVHLDVRDLSYHWVDGTPPGRRWGEWGLPRQGLAQRDERYREEDDLPEAIGSAQPALPSPPTSAR